MKVATWNVNSLNVRLPHVLAWCAESEPDILGLQETKLVDEKFPAEELRSAGYETAFAGQPTYNGVALMSRRGPAEDVVTDIPDLDDPQRRIIAGTFGDLRVINLYVVNGKEVGSDKFEYKLHWLEKVTAWIETEMARHEHVVVMGDFNIAPDDRDVHDPEAWADGILCSAPERDALAKIQGLGLEDTFRLFEQPEKTFSWWDYRRVAFRRNAGLRIDLVLASKVLAASCTKAWIDKEPRRQERPSDHTPAIAEFDLDVGA
ncbi:MAG: exodeoxyribonuclease III [Pseudomonadota bacterium]